MDKLLLAVRKGEISFRECYERILPDAQKMAGAVFWRWRRQLPLAYDEDDICAELIQGIWEAIAKWDPSRGVSLKKFAVWHAHERVKVEIQKQRNAYERRGKSPSRFPIPESMLSGGRLPEPSVGPEQIENVVLFGERWRAAAAQCSRVERALLDSVQNHGYDLRAAVGAIYDGIPIYERKRAGVTRSTVERAVFRSLAAAASGSKNERKRAI